MAALSSVGYGIGKLGKQHVLQIHKQSEDIDFVWNDFVQIGPVRDKLHILYVYKIHKNSLRLQTAVLLQN